MPDESPADETAAHGIGEGIRLALKAEDGGDWRPVAEWLARNPELAGELANFLAAQRGLRSAAAPLRPHADRAGSVIGGLELKEEIGRGAMGVVYRAFDPVLKRDVAVKMVRAAGGLSPVESARFRLEAEVVASLDHPNIVPVHSCGEIDGEPYLVMPLMTGSLAKSLRDLGPDRLMDPKNAAELVRDIALGVHHAHQRGLIHRDLKPGNILLDRDGAPHVADFGLARPLDVVVSVSGDIAGTVAYMAPEQARGEKGLTTAIDVHALGVILFELLTGGVPYGGDVGSILRKLTDPNEPSPSVRKFRPDAPPDLAAICQKCLERSPNHRYPSSRDVADDLGRFLAREPVKARPRGLLSAVGGALGWQREALDMGSWRLLFWGAASTVFAMAVMQAGILLGAPLWVSHAAIAWYLVAWLGLMWVFLVVRRDLLNPVERASMAIHFGAKFGCAAILPVQMGLHDGNPVFALPSFLAIVGLAVFAHGVLYWGRFYLVGLVLFAIAAAFPLVPVTYWPGAYGLLLGGLQLQSGFHLRRVHREAEAAVRASVPPSL